MKSNERITELLFETGAFRVLDKPVILTSGKIGIYYINTEKLLQDDGEWKKYENDSLGMINHAVEMMVQQPTFGEVIDILTGDIGAFIHGDDVAISGGQRRDWLFSGPVAMKLGIPHVSLYKDGSILYIQDKKVSYDVPAGKSIDNLNITHMADLMTTGSSAYDPKNDPATGWIPMLRNQGAYVTSLFNIVTRLQGGEQILKRAEVEARSFVAIDEGFVNQGWGKSLINEHQRGVALAYIVDPDKWGRNYILYDGIEPFVETFNPEEKQLNRARKFLRVYESVLKETKKWGELDDLIRKEYNIRLEGI